MKRLGILVSFLGAVLLIVTALGHFTGLGDYAESTTPRRWERFDPSLVAALDSFDELLQYTRGRVPKGATDAVVMGVLFDTVIARFTHKDARHTFFGNWLLFLAGKLHPTLAHIWDPDVMVARGDALLCDQASYLLLSLAREHGVRARHVGLFGHVVMEAWYDSGWHLYDPDFEVMPVGGDGRVLGVEELARNEALLEKYYGAHSGVAEMIRSRFDNTYMSYPEGARFEWKSNVLAVIESAMQVLKFVLPLALVVLGSWLVGRARWSLRRDDARRD